MKADRLQRVSERLLLGVGLFLISLTALSLLRYHLFQALPSEFSSNSSLSTNGAPSGWRSSYLLLPGLTGASAVRVTGKLVLPRLGLSVRIVDGDEEQGLSVAAVHLAGSAPLGQLGNAVIAGHRDTAFWPLRNVRVGDMIEARTSNTFRYRVTDIRIVQPDDTSVLNNTSGSVLTLVTCYPFRAVGSAPQRFIVRARLAG